MKNTNHAVVTNRNTGAVIATTRNYSTWEQAQRAAERLARKCGLGDACAIHHPSDCIR